MGNITIGNAENMEKYCQIREKSTKVIRHSEVRTELFNFENNYMIELRMNNPFKWGFTKLIAIKKHTLGYEKGRERRSLYVVNKQRRCIYIHPG